MNTPEEKRKILADLVEEFNRQMVSDNARQFIKDRTTEISLLFVTPKEMIDQMVAYAEKNKMHVKLLNFLKAWQAARPVMVAKLKELETPDLDTIVDDYE